MASRVMHQNLEAEMSVLGVTFLNPYAMEKIMEKVRIETGLAPEDYEIKRIKKSLANCNVENSFITINPDIVAYDEKTIEYVILHEFCHLKYKIRTKNFWKMVRTYMPNYEQYAVALGNVAY